MAHEFHVDRESGRLDVLVSGMLMPGEVDGMLAEMKHLCRRDSLRAVLVVPEGIAGAPDDLTLYRLGRDYAEFARGRLWMAVVKTSPRGLDRFFGEVAREQGAAYEVFDTRAEAEAWLTTGENRAEEAPREAAAGARGSAPSGS